MDDAKTPKQTKADQEDRATKPADPRMTPTAFKPLDDVDLRPGALNKAKPQQTAAQRLREFEDLTVGKDAIRSKDGHIERGFGSKFKLMTDEQHARYAALEKLVAAEDKVAAANVAVADAKVAYDAALEDLARLEKQLAA
jgi:hypothetical protein